MDILPRLLLPLAGPEEFDDDDMGKLPDDLQYLEPDKKREADADLRKMLVEAINQVNSETTLKWLFKIYDNVLLKLLSLYFSKNLCLVFNFMFGYACKFNLI